MASSTYDVAITKRGKAFLELQIQALQDDTMHLFPSLVLRVLALPEGSPLAAERLYHQETLEACYGRFISKLEILKVDGPVASYKVWPTAELFEHLQVGSWESYDYPSDKIEIMDAAFSEDGKTVITGYRTRLAAAATLQAVTKRGFGKKIKRWLNHPELCAVAATPGAWWTAGGKRLLGWNKAGAKVTTEHELQQPVTSLAAVGERVLVGTELGQLAFYPTEEVVRANGAAITSLSATGDRWIAGCSSGELLVGNKSSISAVVGLSEAGAITSVAIAEDGRWLASAGGDRGWVGAEGTLEREHRELTNRDVSFASIYEHPLPIVEDQVLTKSYNDSTIYSVSLTTGQVAPKHTLPFEPDVLGVSADGRLLWAGTSRPEQQVAIVVDGELHHEAGPYTFGRSPSAEPVISVDGRKLALSCALEDNQGGYVAVFDASAKRWLKLPNPNSEYDFITGMAFVGDDLLLVAYGNHDAVRWKVSKQEIVDTVVGRLSWLIQRGSAAFALHTENNERSISSWLDGQQGPIHRLGGEIPEYWEPTLYGASSDGATIVLASEGDRFVVLGGRGDPWMLEGLSTARLSPDGRWLANRPAGVDWDSPVKPNLYAVSDRARAREFPEVGSCELRVVDDGSVWVLTTDEIRIYGPDGAETATIKPPPPSEVALIINSVGWLAGEPHWMCSVNVQRCGFVPRPGGGALMWDRHRSRLT